MAAGLVGTFTGHTSQVNGVAWVGEDRIVSCSDDATLKLWSVGTQKLLATLEGHVSWVYCVCWLGDGRIASGGEDRTLRIWDIGTQECLRLLLDHAGGVSCVASLGGGKLVSGSYDGTMRIWSADSDGCLGTCTGHEGPVTAVAPVPRRKGQVATGCVDWKIRLWDLATQQCVATLVGHTADVMTVMALEDGRIISGGSDQKLKLWDLESKSCVATFYGHSSTVFHVAALGPDKVISCALDNKALRVWEVATQTCINIHEMDHTATCWRILICPDCRIVTASWDQSLKLWDFDYKPAVEAVPAVATVDVESLQCTLEQRTQERDAALASFKRLTEENARLCHRLQQALQPATGDNPLAQTVHALSQLQAELDWYKQHSVLADVNQALVVEPPASDVDPALRLEPVHKMGEGPHGAVFAARRAGTDGPAVFALKRLPLQADVNNGKPTDDGEHKFMERLMTIVHPQLAQYRAAYSLNFEDPTAGGMQCVGRDLCAGGSLASLTRMPDTVTMHAISLQTMQGLAVLHGQVPVVLHGAMKPENICLVRPLGDGPVLVKLTDFGLAVPAEAYGREDDVFGAALALLQAGVGSGTADVAQRFRVAHGDGLANVLTACVVADRRQRLSARAAFVALQDLHV